MWLKLGSLLVAILGYCSVIFYARRDARKAEQLANLRREAQRNAKEQEKANEINNAVAGMSDSDVSDRLSNISSK